MIELKRLYNWRSRLATMIDDYTQQPFVWGESDCAIGLACRWVEAVTGTDVHEQYVGRYTDAESAAAFLADHGFDDLPSFLAAQLPEVAPSFARNGDIACIRTEGGEWAIGGVGIDRVYVARPGKGYGTVSRDRIERAYRVG